MRNITLFLSLAVSAMTMTAALPTATPSVRGKQMATQVFEPGKKANVNKLLEHKISPKMKAMTETSLREAEKLYNVTVTFDGTDARPGMAIYNEKFYTDLEVDYEAETNKTRTVQVPAGTYDFSICFWSQEHDTFGYLVREQFEVNADMSLTISESEATELCRFYPTMKDGQKADVPIMNWETGETDSSKATAQYYGLDYALYRDGCEPFATGMAHIGLQDSEEGGYEFVTSKMSDKYHLTLLCFLQTNDNNIEISLSDIEGPKSGTFTSYNKDFVEYKVPEFFHTPLYNKEGREKLTCLVSGGYWRDDYQLGGGGLYLDKMPKIEVTQQPMPDNASDYKVAVMFQNIDMDKTIEFEEDGEVYKDRVQSGVQTLPAIYSDGKWNYVNRGHSECGNFSYQVPEKGEIVEYPGHPRFSFTADEINGKFGNSAPLFITMQQVNTYDGQTFRTAEAQAYLGRYGELRFADMWDLKTVVNLDGKKAFDSADGGSMDEWLYNHNVEGPTGVIDMMFENRNVIVDQTVEGSNIATLHYDENAADIIAPTPQMLQFRNKADEITERFDKAEDGIVELACADFVWHSFDEPADGYNHFFFTAQPCELKVEASAYQKDSFKEVAMTEDPDLFFMPGFGYFYRGSLADVEANSSNGWYDLRITVSDAAGNYLTQTLSPAFAIGEYAAITTVASEAADAPAEYFTIQGVRVANPTPGQLLIRRQGTSVSKILF